MNASLSRANVSAFPANTHPFRSFRAFRGRNIPPFRPQFRSPFHHSDPNSVVPVPSVVETFRHSDPNSVVSVPSVVESFHHSDLNSVVSVVPVGHASQLSITQTSSWALRAALGRGSFLLMKYHPVARSEDLLEGKGRPYTVEGRHLALVRVNGVVRALEDLCPHAGGTIAFGPVQDGRIMCPWHFAEFDVCTGQVLSGPAEEDIPSFPVREENGIVSVAIE